MYKFLLVLSIISTTFFAQSKQISLTVLSSQNTLVSNVVVYLSPKHPTQAPAPTDVAIMDQVNTQYFPHILAIQKDTLVRFPNSDSVKHHVYSFSPAKTFELRLYKELKADPLLFSKAGSVELCCNIHDWMLGYIFVVDTPYFGKTDEEVRITLDVPDGEYQLDVWHPRIQDDLSALSRTITLPNESNIEIKLSSTLLPDVEQYEDVSDEFSDYE